MFRSGLAALIFMANFFVADSHADEQMRTLAMGGGWVAMSHSVSMIAPPDVCAVMNMVSGVGIRADRDGIELRASNSSWSLPPDVKGIVRVSIGSWSGNLDIHGNTEDSISAAIDNDIALTMFAAMDKAANMSVTIGKAKPFQVSLKGSARATSAFRTCAGINSNAKEPGSNPFE
jgi:hypothetical protein